MTHYSHHLQTINKFVAVYFYYSDLHKLYEPSFFHNIIKPSNTLFYSKNRNIYSAIFIYDSIMMCSCVDQSIKIRLECKQQIQELKAI